MSILLSNKSKEYLKKINTSNFLVDIDFIEEPCTQIYNPTIGKIKQIFFVKLIKIGSKLQKIFAIVLLYIGIEITLAAFGIPGLLPFI